MMTAEELEKTEREIARLRNAQGQISNVIRFLENQIREHYCEKVGEPCAQVHGYGVITRSEIRSPVWLMFASKHKIKAIKAVREIYGFGLAEAKQFVENGCK